MKLNSYTSDSIDGKYLLLQLFAFLCGSLLTLIYAPYAMAELSARAPALLIAAIFALAAAFSASMCACVVMPLLSAAFGAAVAFGSVMICAGIKAGGEGVLALSLIILAAVPLHFIIGSASLGAMERVRKALSGGEPLARARYARLYLAAASAAAASTLIVFATFKFIDI